MSQVRITIDTDNAAFDDTPGFEVARILANLSRQRTWQMGRLQSEEIALLDSNGNTVGKCEIVED